MNLMKCIGHILSVLNIIASAGVYALLFFPEQLGCGISGSIPHCESDLIDEFISFVYIGLIFRFMGGIGFVLDVWAIMYISNVVKWRLRVKKEKRSRYEKTI